MLVYGRNVALEYLNNPKDIKRIYLQDSFSDEKIISLIEKNKLNVITKTKNELDQLAKGVHQGIILDVHEYVYKELDDIINKSDDSFIVILDHIEDPHNLGAIIRTCEAAGVDGIIIPKDRSTEVNATVLKTSAGAIKNCDVVQVVNLNQTIKELKDNGYWIYGTAMETDTSYRDVDYKGKVAIIIGNEGHGMSRLVKEASDFIVRIPMYGKVNSLNASVSAGIMIYEVLRQKNK